MHSSLISHHSTLQNLYTRHSTRHTPRGILSLVTRHTFALYCLYRLLSAAYSTLLIATGHPRQTRTEDPISRILAFLAQHFLSPSRRSAIDIEGWRRIISFVLVGVVIGGSINAVLATVRRVGRPRTGGSGTETLGVSLLAGTYFVSTTLMVRGNLPERDTGGLSRALGSSLLTKGMFEGWFDAVFLATAVLTGIGLVIARSWGEEDIEMEGKEV
jgi:hypothetical protein